MPWITTASDVWCIRACFFLRSLQTLVDVSQMFKLYVCACAIFRAYVYVTLVQSTKRVRASMFPSLKLSDVEFYRSRGAGKGSLLLGRRAHRVQLYFQQRNLSVADEGRRGVHQRCPDAAGRGLPNARSGGNVVHWSGAAFTRSFLKCPQSCLTMTRKKTHSVRGPLRPVLRGRRCGHPICHSIPLHSSIAFLPVGKKMRELIQFKWQPPRG